MPAQAPPQTARGAQPSRRGARRAIFGHGLGLWVIASAFLTAMAYSAVPTPLYVLYQDRDHLSSFMVTVVYAIYALGVIVSLFLAGHISDWHGRRRVLLLALFVEVVSAVLFITWPTLAGLLVARVLTGLGIGMITATATAYLSELHAKHRPHTGRARTDLMATAANLGGLGIGPLVSGLLAGYVSEPLRTPYAVFLALLIIAGVGVALVPETVERHGRRNRYRPQRVSVPAAARPQYFAAAFAAFAAFAVLGLFASLAPGFVAGTLHHPSRVLAGAVAFLVFGTAAMFQILLGRGTVRRQLAIGLIFTAAGLIPVSVALWTPNLGLFLAGGAVTGAGAGALLKGSISSVAALTQPAVRGEALAGLFLVGYIGLVVPVVGLGVATQFVASKVALLGFAVAVLVVIVTVSRRLLHDKPVAS